MHAFPVHDHEALENFFTIRITRIPECVLVLATDLKQADRLIPRIRSTEEMVLEVVVGVDGVCIYR